MIYLRTGNINMWKRRNAARRKGKAPERKTRPLEPLKEWSPCPLELPQALILLELLHAPLQLLWVPLELLKAPMQLF